MLSDTILSMKIGFISAEQHINFGNNRLQFYNKQGNFENHPETLTIPPSFCEDGVQNPIAKFIHADNLRAVLHVFLRNVVMTAITFCLQIFRPRTWDLGD